MYVPVLVIHIGNNSCILDATGTDVNVHAYIPQPPTTEQHHSLSYPPSSHVGLVNSGYIVGSMMHNLISAHVACSYVYLDDDCSTLVSRSLLLVSFCESAGGAKLSRIASSLLFSEPLLSLRGIPDEEVWIK